VEAPRLKTYGELLEYWQAQQFTPEELFKVCYTAIVERLNDDPPDLAMLAASLISHGDPTYRHYGELYAFLLDHFMDYDRPVINYGGGSGDTVADIVQSYARILRAEGHPGPARDIIEELLSKRKKEINPQLLQLLSLDLADAYVALGDRDRARAVLTQALSYPGDWDQRIKAALQRL